MSANPERLTCVSMILCDVVYRDERTKKLLIIGTFNRIMAPSVPCAHSRFEVLFTLTNGRGKYDLSLTIEHAQTGHQVAEVRGPLAIADPLAVHDINLSLKDLVFPEAGRYWVVLKADGEIVSQRPFVVQVPEPATRENEDERS